MMRNRKSTYAKQVLRMSGIYMRRIVASSLKFPRLPGVPSPPICESDLQGGHEGELLEIEMQEFLDYLHIYDPNV